MVMSTYVLRYLRVFYNQKLPLLYEIGIKLTFTISEIYIFSAMFRSNQIPICFPIKKLFAHSNNVTFKCQYDFNRNLEIHKRMSHCKKLQYHKCDLYNMF